MTVLVNGIARQIYPVHFLRPKATEKRFRARRLPVGQAGRARYPILRVLGVLQCGNFTYRIVDKIRDRHRKSMFGASNKRQQR